MADERRLGMSFCKYCGTQLGEGMLCNCEKAVAERNGSTAYSAGTVNNVSNINNVNNVNNTGNANGVNGQAGSASYNNGELNININVGALSQIWVKFLMICKKPVTAGREFIKTATMMEIMIFILIQGICSGLFAAVEINRINYFMKSKMGEYEDLITKYLFSGIKGFFVTLMFSVLISVIFAAVIFCVLKIKKESVDFREVLGIVSVRSAVEAPVIFVAAILLFVYIPVAGMLFYISSLIGIFIVAFLLSQYEKVGEDYTVYIMIAVVIVMLFVYYIVTVKGIRLYLPSAINREIDKIPTISDMLESIEKELY